MIVNYNASNDLIFAHCMGIVQKANMLASFSIIDVLLKTVDFSRIRTQVIGVEGNHADHLTTTTALDMQHCYNLKLKFLNMGRTRHLFAYFRPFLNKGQ